jgi:predicted kinase
MKVIFTVGVSCAGKSTWADAQYSKNPTKVRIICRDWIRHQILTDRTQNDGLKGYNVRRSPTNIWNVWKFGKDEKLVTDMWMAEIETAVSAEYETVILADTNLNKGRVENIKNMLIRDYCITDFEVVVFDISLEEAWRRDAARADGVGQAVIFRQWLQYQDFINFGEKYVPVKDTPKAVLFDIDGTLATKGDRGFFEWSKVGVDDVREEIRDMAAGFHSQGYRVIVMSGRDGICQKETVNWLHNNNVPFDDLFMRKVNDMRKDSIIKSELFFEHVAPFYNVKLVVDDRNQVVINWMKLGLKVAHVGNPWISF